MSGLPAGNEAGPGTLQRAPTDPGTSQADVGCQYTGQDGQDRLKDG
jgi:hypothetical protein